MKTTSLSRGITSAIGHGGSARARERGQRWPALAAVIAALLLLWPGVAPGQSALDGFDPNANGIVHAVVVQPDGKILVGGDFKSVLGTERNGIARLNADGTLDMAFNPNARTVYAIALQADGKILVGGNFLNVGGQGRDRQRTRPLGRL